MKPKLFPTKVRGVYRDKRGRVWIKAEQRAPSGSRRYLGPRLARHNAALEPLLAAQVEISEWKRGVREGVWEEAEPCDLSFSAWLDRLTRARELRESTVRSYSQRRAVLYRMIGDVDIRDLSPSRVEAVWGELLASGRARSTLQNLLVDLRWAFSHALRAGHIRVDPTLGLSVPKEHRTRQLELAPSAEEIARFVSALYDADAEDGSRYRGYGALALMLVLSGARGEELRRSAWDAFSEPGWLWITPDADKVGRGRMVPLPSLAAAVLTQHRLRMGIVAPNECDLPWPIDRASYHKRMKSAREVAGVEWTPHKIRSAIRSYLERQKYRDALINVLLGHGKQPRGVERRYSKAFRGELLPMAEDIGVWTETALQSSASPGTRRVLGLTREPQNRAGSDA